MVVRVSVYEDQQGRRFVDVEGDHEPQMPGDEAPGAVEGFDHTKIDGRRVRVSDLLDAGLLAEGVELVWARPRVGDTYHAKVLENGAIQLPDGRTYSSPSRAAMEAADVPAYDGWYAWRVGDSNGPKLNDLRADLAAHHTTSEPLDGS